MLENSWILKTLAAAAGVTLSLGVAVGVGAVPQLGDGTVRAASVAVVEEQATDARHAGDDARTTAGQAAPATTVAATPATQPAPTTTAPRPRTTTPPTTKAPASTRTTSAPAATTVPTAAAPAPTPAVAAATKVARRTPSAAEVNAAISQLKQQVGGLLLLVSPTPEQIAQAGDQVCAAFDNGQTFAQVKATGLSMIPASITVSPATADWAVRQAVTLYCPGHASKLV